MSKLIRIAALLLGLFATAAAVTACGSSPSATAGGAAASPAAGQGGMQAYTACLSQHGVTLPSGFPGGNRPTDRPTDRPSGGPRGGGFGNQAPAGVDPQAWQQAQQACASLRPTGGGQNRNNGANTAYRNCLTDHGVTMSGGPAGLDSNDPKVADAMKACEALRPTARPSATG